MGDLEKGRLKYMAEVDPAELAVRLIERAGRCRRPSGKTALQVLERMPSDMRDMAIAQAITALDYVSECFAGAGRVS